MIFQIREYFHNNGPLGWNNSNFYAQTTATAWCVPAYTYTHMAKMESNGKIVFCTPVFITIIIIHNCIQLTFRVRGKRRAGLLKEVNHWQRNWSTWMVWGTSVYQPPLTRQLLVLKVLCPSHHHHHLHHLHLLSPQQANQHASPEEFDKSLIIAHHSTVCRLSGGSQTITGRDLSIPIYQRGRLHPGGHPWVFKQALINKWGTVSRHANGSEIGLPRVTSKPVS